MRLILTRPLRLFDHTEPMTPGEYTLERIPNPGRPQPHNPYWDPWWLVIAGTTVGMSEGAWRHEFLLHHDPQVRLEL